MVSSISSNDLSDIHQAMLEMYQKMGAANTDGNAGLSKSELSSIGSTSDIGDSSFLKSLTAQFDEIDTDRNGQISGKEISEIKAIQGAMGPPPGMEIKDLAPTEAPASTSSTSATAETDALSGNILEELIAKLLESMAESFSKDTPEGSEEAQNPLAALTASVDKDGVSGLSMNELSSASTSNDAGKANFIDKLIKNFENIDSDANGQLSQSEISALKLNNSAQTTATESIGNSLGKISDAIIQRAITSYQNGGLSNLASSLNVAG